MCGACARCVCLNFSFCVFVTHSVSPQRNCMQKSATLSVSCRGQHSPFFRSAFRHYCFYLVQHDGFVFDKLFTFFLDRLPVQDENMISFIKGGIKVRNSYQTYKWDSLTVTLKAWVFSCFSLITLTRSSLQRASWRPPVFRVHSWRQSWSFWGRR